MPQVQTNIRPSASFVSANRHNVAQKIYIDQYDGPSSLVVRDNLATLKETSPTRTLVYEEERSLAKQKSPVGSYANLHEVKDTDRLLLSPSQRL